MKPLSYILLAAFFLCIGSLYSQANNEREKPVNKKRWKLNDLLSPPPTYHIPSDSQKLKPRFQETHLHFGYQRMVYNIWGQDYLLPPSANSEVLGISNRRYFETPKVNQFYFGVEVRPWLKTGFVTHQRQAMDSGIFMSRDEAPRITGDIKLYIDFRRTWGIYAEFTPFPVKYLRVRRYELNFGGALMRENIDIRREIWVGYNIDQTRWGYIDRLERTEISSYSFTFYGSLSVFVLPWLSLQSRVGYYIIPKGILDPIELDLPSGYPDLRINYQPIDFSWHFYTIGLNLHL